MIRTSSHTATFANKTKKEQVKKFLLEYRRCTALLVDHLWNNRTTWGNNRVLDIQNGFYDCPTFISTVGLDIQTTMSARALKCCSDQACGMVKAATEKPKKRKFQLEKLKEKGLDSANLERAIVNQKIVKPTVRDIKAELNSICCSTWIGED